MAPPRDFNGEPAWGIRKGLIISIYPTDIGRIPVGKWWTKSMFRSQKKNREKVFAWVNFLSVEQTTKLGGRLCEYERIDFLP